MLNESGLLLEDGTWFEGNLHGEFEDSGEVVFNTSMTGYQEVISDPSYCDQLIVMTYPLIGNYGISTKESEATQIACKGLIVKEFFEFEETTERISLQNYLNDHNIPVLSGVDTRSLVKKIREQGTMKGRILKSRENTEQEMLTLSKAEFLGTVGRCSTPDIKVFGEGNKHIALYDFGYKKSILESLLNRGMKVSLLPYQTSFEKLEELNIDGVVISNGPGDPEEHESLIPTIQKIQETYPMLGICLGHQLFALANGAKTQKMHFGHRGGNHAVYDIPKDRTYLSSQNHGYEVNNSTIDTNKLEVTHVNVNDKSIEGLRSLTYPAFSVQFHPEANPGPTDSAHIFDEFIQSLEKRS